MNDDLPEGDYSPDPAMRYEDIPDEFRDTFWDNDKEKTEMPTTLDDAVTAIVLMASARKL